MVTSLTTIIVGADVYVYGNRTGARDGICLLTFFLGPHDAYTSEGELRFVFLGGLTSTPRLPLGVNTNPRHGSSVNELKLSSGFFLSQARSGMCCTGSNSTIKTCRIGPHVARCHSERGSGGTSSYHQANIKHSIRDEPSGIWSRADDDQCSSCGHLMNSVLVGRHTFIGLTEARVRADVGYYSNMFHFRINAVGEPARCVGVWAFRPGVGLGTRVVLASHEERRVVGLDSMLLYVQLLVCIL
ncbi:hypothetical protein OPQ81_008731 [Rhizoctonia solani]|nr:hypothetical protein OPQ81_008731 [Rhizoctonia solani]